MFILKALNAHCVVLGAPSCGSLRSPGTPVWQPMVYFI